ncbi:cytochrome b [Acidocella sp.]|jgi:cytochrome b561|uniref:cytochrome b n=1 Tax=Acidocella sp. TaxID=50710 RepID=UPI002F3FB5E3
MDSHNERPPVTRVAAGDDLSPYDKTSIALHWTTASLIFLLFGLEEVRGFFSLKSTRHMVDTIHVSFGLILIFVLGLRIIWRLRPGRKTRDAGTGIIERAAKAVHFILYVLLSGQAFLGILTRWTDNHPLTFFGLQIPSPFGSFSKATGDFVYEIHDVMAWVIMGFVGVHATAALFHHFILRDDILTRMLPRRRNS